MNTLKSFSQYCENRGIPKGLAAAVVRQHGGWKSFKECAVDFARHGVDSGFSGFVYYSETVPFAQKHRQLIAELAESQSEDCDYGVIDMIQGFRGFAEKPKSSVVARCLYGNGDDWEVLNVLACYTAEEVLGMFADFVEE